MIAEDDSQLAGRWKDLCDLPTDLEAQSAGALWGGEQSASTVEVLSDHLGHLEELGLIDAAAEVSGRHRMHDLMRDLALSMRSVERFDEMSLSKNPRMCPY